MANKRWPTCGVRYTGPEKFCTKCGGLPAKDENPCSENKKNIRKDEKKR